MIIYDGNKSDFMESVDKDTIAEEIERNIYNKMNKKTAVNEFRSWENSLQYMYKVLNVDEIPDNTGIAIEYNIPQTSKRVDFIISGYDQKEEPNVVIVELKQWDELKAVEGQDGLVETYTGHAVRKVVHPSYQSWSYAKMIEDYNASVQYHKIKLSPCAYLHNYRRKENDPLDYEQYKEYLDDSPAFCRGEVPNLRKFIENKIVSGDDKQLIYEIDHGSIRPSKSLQNALSSMVKGNKEFIMLDEQKVVYEEILEQALKCKKDKKKRTIIVSGGPGTGKTVVAIDLLCELTRHELFAQYVSKNSAPRNVYLKKLKGELKKSTIDNMFKGSGSYTEMDENKVDVLLVDEAHRLNEKSGMFSNLGENQIKEIIHSSLCSVFFIDEKQRVTLKDIGSRGEIEKWSKQENSEIMNLKLSSQFRCNGSDGYLSWIDNVLEIEETANYDLKDIDYEFKVCDSPQQMRDIIFEKNKQANRARMLAGYCWNWIKEGKNDSDIHDIKIGDFEISWNLGNSSTWAIDPESVKEAGCIHTSQGLEFDYVGVIIGKDLRYENDHIITDFSERASTDQSLKGIKKLYKQDPEKATQVADEIIKNTYRTLLTRGMKGCYVYCVDKTLEEYLKRELKKSED